MDRSLSDLVNVCAMGAVEAWSSCREVKSVTGLWRSRIGSHVGQNRLWVRFLAVSDIYPMFIEPTITWVLLGLSGYLWLDTKIVLKKYYNLISAAAQQQLADLWWCIYLQELTWSVAIRQSSIHGNLNKKFPLAACPGCPHRLRWGDSNETPSRIQSVYLVYLVCFNKWVRSTFMWIFQWDYLAEKNGRKLQHIVPTLWLWGVIGSVGVTLWSVPHYLVKCWKLHHEMMEFSSLVASLVVGSWCRVLPHAVLYNFHLFSSRIKRFAL